MKVINLAVIGLDFVLEAENRKYIVFLYLWSHLFNLVFYIIGSFFILDGLFQKFPMPDDRYLHVC